jgi:ubiquitin-like-conjugating enzyme ATG10
MQLVPFGYCSRRPTMIELPRKPRITLSRASSISLAFGCECMVICPILRDRQPSAMDKLSDFPYLTVDEFVKACDHVQLLLPDSAVLAAESACLRITRRLAAVPGLNADCHDHIDLHLETPEDHDEEAIIKHSQAETFVTVHYDILLSPSYRVPVVYMIASPPLPVSQFFDLVVPHHFRDAMRQVGVMGALSMTVILGFAEPASPADLVLAGPSFDRITSILCTSLSHCRHYVCHGSWKRACSGLYASVAGYRWGKCWPECVEHRIAPCVIEVVYSSSLSSMASSSSSMGASSSFPSSLSSLGRFTPAV